MDWLICSVCCLIFFSLGCSGKTSWTAKGYQKGASSINMMNSKITTVIPQKACSRASLNAGRQMLLQAREILPKSCPIQVFKYMLNKRPSQKFWRISILTQTWQRSCIKQPETLIFATQLSAPFQAALTRTLARSNCPDRRANSHTPI